MQSASTVPPHHTVISQNTRPLHKGCTTQPPCALDEEGPAVVHCFETDIRPRAVLGLGNVSGVTQLPCNQHRHDRRRQNRLHFVPAQVVHQNAIAYIPDQASALRSAHTQKKPTSQQPGSGIRTKQTWFYTMTLITEQVVREHQPHAETVH